MTFFILISNSKNTNIHTTDRINDMIFSGEIPEIVTAEIIRCKLNPNQFICVASSCGNAELVRDLLEMGASPKHRSRSGVPASCGPSAPAIRSA